MAAVDIIEAPTQREFEDHMRPLGKPLVVTGWMKDWEASQKWTFPFFKETYGEDTIVASTSLKRMNYAIQLPLGDYVDYILDVEGNTLGKIEETFEVTRPFYCYSYKPFQDHPELLQDFRFPEFIGDWFRHFPKTFRRLQFPQKQGWIHLGVTGVVSELHTDAHCIITCLAQFEGVKRFTLFSPEDSPFLYKGRVNPTKPDLEKFPLFKNAKPIEVLLEAGSMIFLPPNWWHHVVALESSITMVWPFVNHLNLGDYIVEAYKGKYPRALAAIPGELPPTEATKVAEK